MEGSGVSIPGVLRSQEPWGIGITIGALIIRIGFWGVIVVEPGLPPRNALKRRFWGNTPKTRSS